MGEQLKYNLKIAIDAILSNKMRSFLTGLGIIFGVAAVIMMVAVGRGAQQEILEQIKMVGVNNIVILPDNENEARGVEEAEPENDKYSPGLSLEDVKSIREVLSSVESVCPEVAYETHVTANGLRRSTKLIGVNTPYFEVFNLKLAEGNVFSEQQNLEGKAVCVIGSNLAARMFPKTSPMGKYIKCGIVNFKVIGILGSTDEIGNTLRDLGINNYNDEVYAPLQTLLLRFENRSLITQRDIEGANSSSSRFSSSGSEGSSKPENINQLDKIVVRLADTKQINPTLDVLYRLMKRLHLGVEDFRIIVPESELKQQKATDDQFKWLLLAIASISLIVGGIGIMNIMLASVLERTKEIGLRLAVGARKEAIRAQFISEAFVISVSGGLLGILLGVLLSLLISLIFDRPTDISITSILVAFFVSAGVGIVFGYMPAKRAAEQDPVKSLRYE